MPIYEYQCQECDTVLEIMQKTSDEQISNCPTCKSRMKKLMSLSSFAFKGSGFYTTDYKRAGRHERTKW